MIAGYAPELESIRRDVGALAAMSRSSAREGERESAAWILGRLGEAGIPDARIEPYRYQPTYALAHGLHDAAGITASLLGGPLGAAIAAATLWSYEMEVSGARQWLRRLLPAGEGANVVARVPAAGGARATLVLVAHHDAANTGLIWSPGLVQAGAARHLRRRRVEPFAAPIKAALGISAIACLAPRRGRAARALAAGALALGLLAVADVARSETVPGACDNASGVAVCIDLLRALAAEPLAEIDVLVAFTGSEEAGMGGMAAFLQSHGAELQERPSFLLGLDTLGAGRPIVCSGEGAMREQRYRERDIALVQEGATLAGAPAPERWRIGGWTDPVLALHRGVPCASLLSIGSGYYPNYHHPSDTPEHVSWSCVSDCAMIAAGTIEAFRRSVAAPSQPRTRVGSAARGESARTT